MAICPVCQDAAEPVTETDGKERLDVCCPGCGNFVITKTAARVLDSDGAGPKRGVLSHWIRHVCERGQKPEIDQKLLRAILDEQSLPSVSEQADGLLLWLGDELLRLGKPNAVVSLQDYRRLTALLGAAPGPGSGGLMYLAQGLRQRGHIFPSQISQYADRVGLTFDGWKKYEELKRARIESRSAFMATPFGNELIDRLFECFKEAVAQTGFELRRVMDKAPAGLIDNRLRVEIRKSRFMVCELTNANAGAYWEGGFAEGLGRSVIYSCEKSYFKTKGTHFDTNHCQTVLWEESDFQAAAEQLKATIRATLPDEAKLTDK
jgi:hypothetical protein